MLTGSNMNGTRRYRHASGVTCGCKRKSVPCDVLEETFSRLISLLTVDPSQLENMRELALEAQRLHGHVEEVDLEQQKQEAIAACQRRINAAVVLFGDGMIDEKEYRRRVDENNREIAHWQARTTEAARRTIELAMCAEAINKLHQLWDNSDAENRQGMARNLFEEIVYDLDQQCIVDFKLKPWASQFLVLRGPLHELEDSNDDSSSDNQEKRELAQRLLRGNSVYPPLVAGFSFPASLW